MHIGWSILIKARSSADALEKCGLYKRNKNDTTRGKAKYDTRSEYFF